MKQKLPSLFFLIFYVLLITCSCHNAGNKKSATEIILPERGLCAHRGAMDTHPENTFPAFFAAIEAGAHMMEFDVSLTKDNEMVIMHDVTVDRTTNGTGRVSDFTLAEIKQLDAGSWKSPEFAGVRVPTLQETLRIMPVNIWLNIHIKGEGMVPELAAEMVAKENRLHQAFLACGRDAAIRAKKIVPEIMICNMDRRELDSDYVRETIEMKADFIQLRRNIHPGIADFVKDLKQNGVRVNFYGTDIPDEIKTLFGYGVDFPLVNDIIKSIKVAEELNIPPVIPVFVDN